MQLANGQPVIQIQLKKKTVTWPFPLDQTTILHGAELIFMDRAFFCDLLFSTYLLSTRYLIFICNAMKIIRKATKMGIARGAARLLLEEMSIRPFEGTILQLGRQDIYFDQTDLRIWADIHSVQLNWETELQNKKGTEALDFDDVIFFKNIGFDSVYSADISDHEGASYQIDLNHPVDDKFHNRFDVIFDGGTLEHCFNRKQVLENIFQMLKLGGRIIHCSPSTNHVDHGFYMFSPMLFTKFYSFNKWKMHRSYVFKYTKNHNVDPWEIYKYAPGCFTRYSIGGFTKGEILGVWHILEKTEQSTGHLIPQQESNPMRFEKIDNHIQEYENKKIILFGASKLGEKALKEIGDHKNVMCFMDNDKNKVGTFFNGLKVESPLKIPLMDYDLIVITSSYFKEIFSQLTLLGVTDEKIRFFDQPYYRPFPEHIATY